MKPTGELIKADLEKVIKLSLNKNTVSDVGTLNELKLLQTLELQHNHDLNKTQIAELQNKSPKCTIEHNAKK